MIASSFGRFLRGVVNPSDVGSILTTAVSMLGIIQRGERGARADILLAMRRATLLLLLAAAPLAFGQDKDGWISLFNGKDFTGWKVNENTDTFTIKDGAIQANGPRSHCFYVGPVGNHDFTNFELKVDVKTAPVSKGGIYFHTEYQDVGFPKKGLVIHVK